MVMLVEPVGYAPWLIHVQPAHGFCWRWWRQCDGWRWLQILRLVYGRYWCRHHANITPRGSSLLRCGHGQQEHQFGAALAYQRCEFFDAGTVTSCVQFAVRCRQNHVQFQRFL
jgi:hypothetical protein